MDALLKDAGGCYTDMGQLQAEIKALSKYHTDLY